MAGLAIFTLASLAGGLATSAAALLAARAVQGVGGAIATPAVLAAIVASFPEGRERVRALSIFTAVAMGGSSLGLVLGGVITQWASWRWVLLHQRAHRHRRGRRRPRLLAASKRQRGRFDAAGAITSTAGMSALVYGFINAASTGWSDRHAGLVRRRRRAARGVRADRDPDRAADHPAVAVPRPQPRGVVRGAAAAGGGMFGMFFFLTQFVQEVLGFSPLQAGLSFVPMTGALFAMSRLAPRLVPRFGAKPLMVAGLLPVVAGMAWLGQLSTGQLLPRRPGPDAAARHRHGRGLRAAHDGLAGRRAAAGLGRRRQHGERHAAGRRGARPGHPGDDLRHGQQSAARHPLAHAAAAAQAQHVLVHGMAAAFTGRPCST